jgi:ATP-dependent helicase HrpB
MVPLPIDPHIDAIAAALRTHRAAIVVAAPGAGKTTRVPPALAADGAVILLQPRRVAARTIGRRIADERGWTLGAEVGWHVRFDKRFSSSTRLLVATEGILTARLQQDPLLSDFSCIVLDEFHERSIHADLGIALAKQAWRARDDLRVLVMSATLDARRVSEYFDGCPVFDIPGTLHAVDLAYRPSATVAAAVQEVLTLTDGQVLCFLPGAPEVRRTAGELRTALPRDTEVVELHGSLSAEEQDRALEDARPEGRAYQAPATRSVVPTFRSGARRRVIVATNIAETSLTVPGVTAVVDSGQHKVARYDAGRGVNSLDLERISLDSADQRAGRAARLGPGVVRRLWHETDRLRPHREPDIARIDLSGPVLDLLAWGGDPLTFDWFDPPSPPALAAAKTLLVHLGAIQDGRLTPVGRRMSRLPLHPRLARIMVEADGSYGAAIACALLSDRQSLPRHPPTTTCDLLTALDTSHPPHIMRSARDLQRICATVQHGSTRATVQHGSTRATVQHGSTLEEDLRRALLAGYPDRVAQRRAPGDPRVRLASGHGGVIGPESGVRDGEYVLALDVQAGPRGEQSEARIRIASIVDKEWLRSTAIERAHEFDAASGVVRAWEREVYGALILRERDVPVDAAVVAERLADAYLARSRPEHDRQLIERLRFADIDVDLKEVALRAASGRRRLDEIRLADGLDWSTKQRLDEQAPDTFTAPSGRTHALEYRQDGTVALSIKLQELFGLAATPLIGARREPLLILLLAPNGRPVQTTRDLRSFWNTTYPEVRKELRGRYPKHPWPEDPWRAIPTARTRGVKS